MKTWTNEDLKEEVMALNLYRLTLKHDKGRKRITIAANCIADAIDAICLAEKCPPCAVICVDRIAWKTLNKRGN